MPIRWNSTDKMLSAALQMEEAIRAVLATQRWDKSVKEHLTPTDEDWASYKEMAIFFDIFRRPTVGSQADGYPTLHNSIPDFLHILRQLNVWKAQNNQRVIRVAAEAAYEVMAGYYSKSMATRNSYVALLCDPRYKLEILEFLYEAEGGSNSGGYKKAKAHFEHVYSAYNRRAQGIARLAREQAEEVVADAREARGASPTPEPEVQPGQEDWRINPLHGWAEHRAGRPQANENSQSEVARWFAEGTIDPLSTPEQQRVYMLSKAYQFPIIIQMANDFLAIPATSALSERVFRWQGTFSPRDERESVVRTFDTCFACVVGAC